jgi:hypothetical protein
MRVGGGKGGMWCERGGEAHNADAPCCDAIQLGCEGGSNGTQWQGHRCVEEEGHFSDGHFSDVCPSPLSFSPNWRHFLFGATVGFYYPDKKISDNNLRTNLTRRKSQFQLSSPFRNLCVFDEIIFCCKSGVLKQNFVPPFWFLTAGHILINLLLVTSKSIST